MDFDLDRQRRFMHTMADPWKAEYDALPRTAEDRPTGDGFYLNNGMFGSVDAEMLYSVVRSAQPKKVVEIGGGWTSQLISDALQLNGSGKLITIEPNPSEGLRKVKGIDLREVEANGAGGKVFSELNDKDILSIDGSHVRQEKNDVDLYLTYFLPSLKPGVLVQIHDIFLPNAYPPFLAKRGYDEQDHLAVFLNSNPEWKVEFAGNWFSKQAFDELSAQFDSFDHTRISGTIWLRKEMTKQQAEVVLKRKPTKPSSKKKKTTVTKVLPVNAEVAVEDQEISREEKHMYLPNRAGEGPCLKCGKEESEGAHE